MTEDKNVLRQMLTGEGTYGTTLLVWCVDRWGMECLQDDDDLDRGPWRAETFKTMLEDAAGVRIPKANLDKLMAAVCILTTDLFFKDVKRFIDLCNVLSGDDFQPDEFDPADTAECAWGITEALLLSPPDDSDPEPFCDDIRYYVAFVLREEGFVTAPDVLKIAVDADWSDQISYSFSDDPEMFSAVYSKQTEKTDEISDVIRQGLTDLFEQLSALKLKTGNVDGIKERVARMLRAKPKDEG